MVFDLLRRNRQADPVHAAIPRDMRIYAIGDIHGRFDLLLRLMDMIQADAATNPVRHNFLVFLGDYIDRGIASRQVIEFLAAGPPAGFGMIPLIGNHEAAMLEFLEHRAAGNDWFAFGGLATLHSYGVTLPRMASQGDRLAMAQAELRRNLPARHRAFLADLRSGVTIGDYFFVHAGVRPGVPLETQDTNDLIWIRDAFLDSTLDHGKVVVHGHTITEKPELRLNRIGIDTGAFATGRLTALVLQDNTRRFLST